jgi:putative ABC transport system permease protein
LVQLADGMRKLAGGTLAADPAGISSVRAVDGFRPGIAWLLAWRNLGHDRVRFLVTLVGIAFSVVLMAVQWGLLLGSAQTAAGLVDHAKADFWITSRGTSNVDQSAAMPDRWRYKALEVPGVAAVDKMVTRFAAWQRPDGGSEVVIVVGFDLDSGVGGPWNIVEGSIADLHQPDAIIIDRLYAQKLGVSALGQSVEIRGVRARIVGFTEGIRAFTQSPYVFTSVKNARHFGDLGDDQTNYLLVRTAPGADRAAVAWGLRETLSMTDVLSADDFSAMTARYWLLTTGAGAALVVGAALGVVVGIIIVAQTLYAATVERLPEYATLLAIGAPNRYLNRIILAQALISGILGLAIGLVAARVVVIVAANSSFALILPWRLAVAVGGVTLAMCATASLVAIRKIKTIDPTSVFR